MSDDRNDPKVSEREGLGRTISVAGLQVSQAADELAQAAERLMAAEVRVNEAEARWRVAEEQLEQGATKNAELLEMVQGAREAQSEAEERVRRTEQGLQLAIERARALEEQNHELEVRIEASRAKNRELEVRIEEAEAQPEVTVVVDDERNALQHEIAAEVRRPLTSIMGLTLALKHTDPRTSEGGEMVKQLASNARKLDRLVGEMLELDKIASGDFQPNLRRTDIEALVRRVVSESTDLQNRDIKIQTEHLALEVDPALAEQMIETLLANAGRRTTPGNPVWIGLTGDEKGVTVSVDDMGPEIPDGLRGGLFAASTESGPAARRQPRGATGLSLLARLAALHGGRAWVEARPGGGASFRVFLPAASSASSAGDGAAPNDVAAEGAAEVPPAPRTVDDRAAERVRDLADERALALAKALVAADDDDGDEDVAIFDTVTANGKSASITDRIRFDDLTGEIRL
jgi:K+-sensing histidine kinase KdpD